MQTLYGILGYSTKPEVNLFVQTSNIEKKAQDDILKDLRTKTAFAINDFKNGKFVDPEKYKIDPRFQENDSKINDVFVKFHSN